MEQMLGHAEAAMTLNVYGQLFPDPLDELADVLDLHRKATPRAWRRDDQPRGMWAKCGQPPG
ncbi:MULTISPECIES: hypothetical protein [unclassified Amycolatopsis]|uniref:hypothetical protein n=1 Tax=unclassified Amycolatopsis TaxID=2618356 RepID=UPI0021054105|nr:hypothetical protein [Amycolatopsis sp. DSM 110486]